MCCGPGLWPCTFVAVLQVGGATWHEGIALVRGKLPWRFGTLNCYRELFYPYKNASVNPGEIQ